MQVVVVGVDGSAAAAAALRWACSVVDRDGTVHAVHADEDAATTALLESWIAEAMTDGAGAAHVRVVPSSRRAPTAEGLLADADDRVHVLDADAVACPRLPRCDSVIDGRIVWRDQSHMTHTYATTLADALWDEGTLRAVLSSGQPDGATN